MAFRTFRIALLLALVTCGCRTSGTGTASSPADKSAGETGVAWVGVVKSVDPGSYPQTNEAGRLALSDGTLPEDFSPGLDDQDMDLARAMAHYAQGLILADTDVYSTNALAEFHRVVELDPSSIEIPLKLANTYRVAGRTNEAIRILARLRREFPRDSRVPLVIAYTRLVCGEYAAAEQAYLELARSFPAEPYGYVGLARSLTALGREEEAFGALLKGMRKTLDPALVYAETVTLTDRDISEDRMPGAIRRHELVLAARPGYAESAFRLISLYLLDDKLRLATDTLGKLPAVLRENPPFLAAVAVLFQDLDRSEEASAIFEKAERIAKSPGHEKDGILTSVFYLRFGFACDKTGNRAGALSAFSRCIELDPSCDTALNNVAYMWAEQGTNLAQAADYAARALQAEAQNPAYLDTMGWILYKQKDYRAAVDKLLQAQQISPEDPLVSDHLGDAYSAMNDPEFAEVYWAESLRLDPDNEAVAAKLGVPREADRAGRTR